MRSPCEPSSSYWAPTRQNLNASIETVCDECDGYRCDEVYDRAEQRVSDVPEIGASCDFEHSGYLNLTCLNWDFWDWGDFWDFVVVDEEGLRWVGVFFELGREGKVRREGRGYVGC